MGLRFRTQPTPPRPLRPSCISVTESGLPVVFGADQAGCSHTTHLAGAGLTGRGSIVASTVGPQDHHQLPKSASRRAKFDLAGRPPRLPSSRPASADPAADRTG